MNSYADRKNNTRILATRAALVIITAGMRATSSILVLFLTTFIAVIIDPFMFSSKDRR
jgi:hypothetical protein